MNKITGADVAPFLSYGNESEAIADAYLELGITASEDAQEIADEIEECYQGSFESDEDFAQHIAEDLGAVDFKNQPWPAYCIDWEYAARELMMDYSEEAGYYFRNV